ncbi:MAG TPA: GntR family transcriptional regulator, partial [Chitinophagaceae bacterium]|nr:GntR family transcriptional regulator [Chitinophagaceae bacterium]
MQGNKNGKPSLLYLRIAGIIEQQVINGVRQVGDKLPSIRTICREYGVSPSTALQAYHHLESKAVITARPQSGYYVSQSPRRPGAIPKASVPRLSGSHSIDELVERVYNNLAENNRNIPFSLGVPALELLPVARLNKGLIQATREMTGSGVSYAE